jgi:hypothetical protein
MRPAFLFSHTSPAAPIRSCHANWSRCSHHGADAPLKIGVVTQYCGRPFQLCRTQRTRKQVSPVRLAWRRELPLSRASWSSGLLLLSTSCSRVPAMLRSLIYSSSPDSARLFFFSIETRHRQLIYDRQFVQFLHLLLLPPHS